VVNVAHSADQAQLYGRNLDAFVATPIAGTDGAQYPFFSPDMSRRSGSIRVLRG
jgi:hypothetical protein